MRGLPAVSISKGLASLLWGSREGSVIAGALTHPDYRLMPARLSGVMSVLSVETQVSANAV